MEWMSSPKKPLPRLPISFRAFAPVMQKTRLSSNN